MARQTNPQPRCGARLTCFLLGCLAASLIANELGGGETPDDAAALASVTAGYVTYCYFWAVHPARQRTTYRCTRPGCGYHERLVDPDAIDQRLAMERAAAHPHHADPLR